MAIVTRDIVRRWRPRLEQETGKPHRCGFRYSYDDAAIDGAGRAPLLSLKMFQINLGDHDWVERFIKSSIPDQRLRGDGEIVIQLAGLDLKVAPPRKGAGVLLPELKSLPARMRQRDRKLALDVVARDG